MKGQFPSHVGRPIGLDLAENIKTKPAPQMQLSACSVIYLSCTFIEIMGRRKWYKNRHNGKKKNGLSNEARSNSNANETFSAKDRKLLIQYLNEYYERCTDLQRGSFFRTRRSRKLLISDSVDPLVIGGCTFPTLDEVALRQPYLALPLLNAKQRKMIHHLCVYANLYHVGVKLTPIESFVAVSIFRDGLDYAVQESEVAPKVKFLDLKPWLHRLGDSAKAATKVGHDAIYNLIDQPGDSLRDGIDELDFEELKDVTLENTDPPQFEDENWTLIDSPEKMREGIQEMEVRKTGRQILHRNEYGLTW